MEPTTEGVTSNGLPFLAFGEGPPVVVFPGLTMTNEVPTGPDRYFQERMFRVLARHHRIHVLARRPGLPAGSTMADLAADYAEAISADIAPSIPLVGTSTGGSAALQFAIDRPEMVQRLAVVAAGGRLSDRGRAIQRSFGYLVLAGEHRTAWRLFGESLVATPPAKLAVASLLWMLGPTLSPSDPSDMLVTIDAEDRFDVMGRLERITASTLVIGGGRDELYSPEIFEATGAHIPDGRTVVLAGTGHARAAGSGATVRLVTEFLLAD